MKFSAVFAAVAAATLVNAQGYNSTSKPATSSPAVTHVSVYDSRTFNVPAPSAAPTTALTSIYTITSSCGSVQVLLPSTKVFPLNGTASATAARPSATYTGTSTGGAARTGVAILAGAGGLLAALVL